MAGNLRVNVMPDDVFRADLLKLCREQITPVIQDELGAYARSKIGEALDRHLTDLAVMEATRRAVDRPEFQAAMRPVIDEALRSWLQNGVGALVRREAVDAARAVAREEATRAIREAFSRVGGK
jgi:hypothetical protein